jgi:hypothetical protein
MPNSTVPAAATGLPSTEPHGRVPAGAQANVIPADRRGFLRMLAGLPLIGGGLSLIGAPSGTAEPVTRELLESYLSWLAVEYRYLWEELHPGWPCHFGFRPNNAGGMYHWRAFGRPPAPLPSTRAAVVLSAVDCDWKDLKGVRRTS